MGRVGPVKCPTHHRLTTVVTYCATDWTTTHLPLQVIERGATITKSNLSAVCTSAATRLTTRYSCVYIVYMCLYSSYVLTYSVSAATVMSTKSETGERERREGSQHSRWVGSVPIINVHLMDSKLECNHNKQWQQKQRDKKQTRRATQQSKQ